MLAAPTPQVHVDEQLRLGADVALTAANRYSGLSTPRSMTSASSSPTLIARASKTITTASLVRFPRSDAAC